MRRIMKALGIIIVVVLVVSLCLVAAVGGGGYYYLLLRPLPQIDGALQVAGLTGRVEVIRDRWGVPHIYAQNETDLFFAQGYVCAQDRLFQMDLNRRIGSGRLAEVVGQPGLSTDEFMRTLGLRRVAEMEAARLSQDPETQTALEAYARGVNAFIETHRDNLPVEFTILGYTPEPWTPADSLVWGKVMAYSLSGNYSSELLRAALIERLGEERARELTPPYAKDAPVIVPPGVSYRDTGAGELLAQTRQMRAWLGLDAPGIGSNNWVVAGTKTTTGQPLLANDPHLGIQMPSIWWEVHLVGGRFDVIGAAFPGVPGVVIGHNRRIAWGVTNVGPDVQDLYLEKVNPANPRQVEYQGQWEDVRVVQEVIRIKGGETRTIEVLITRHGPIINDVLAQAQGRQPLALRWTALEPGTISQSVLLLDQASNWEEFRAALAYWTVPSQNFVYADVDGNIGYQMPSLVPMRAKGQGLVPVPGWTGEYEWTGYIPFDELPRAYNPAQGYIATANNRVIGDEYPYFISAEWDPGYRATRIVEALEGKDRLSADDFRALHADVTSVPARVLVPALLKLPPQTDDQRRAMDALRGWDYRLTTDSVPAAVYEVWLNRLVRNTFGDELGDLADSYSGRAGVRMLVGLRETPDSPWFDDVTTTGKETWADLALRSLDEAVAFLRERLGGDERGWQWGKLHTATFAHQLGGVKPLDLILNKGPFSNGGDGFTVNNTGYDSQYRQRTVPSYRQIIDLSDWHRCVSVHTTGQSGHPGSPHYADFIPLWLAVDYHPMLYERAAVEANKEGVLVLTP